jgi:hypothetical protein
MERRRKKVQKWSVIGKFLSIGLMFFSLLFLTTANFFVGAALEEANKVDIPVSQKSADCNEDLPTAPNPTEEKTSNNSISIIEEYLHKDHFDFNLFNSGKRVLHQIAVSQKIELVHFKLLSPPPEI